MQYSITGNVMNYIVWFDGLACVRCEWDG